MDWSKHDFGPGTNTCCRCLGVKEEARFGSKWCRACEAQMKSRKGVDGALDSTPKKGVVRRTRIHRGA